MQRLPGYDLSQCLAQCPVFDVLPLCFGGKRIQLYKHKRCGLRIKNIPECDNVKPRYEKRVIEPLNGLS